ncbi:MAG: motility protein A [Candidatus Marinimicrobia bacterium]|nr:motility protein A [Candidatus Neomarinimicrobiota bacterium]
MDIATIFGILAGIGLVVGSILMNSPLDLFWNAPSAMIVGGGTFAAAFIAYPMKEVMSVFGLFGKVFIFKSQNPQDLIEKLVELSKIAKTEGVLALEKKMTDIKDPFFRKALQMTVDGLRTNDIVSILKKEISILQKRHKVGWEIFTALGDFSPAFGMIGTLIGLVQMMADLSDPSSIGPKMAVALLTTFYGTLLANLFFIPMSTKLQRRSDEETINMNLLMEGIISIRSGENPNFMEDRLNIYVQDTKKPKKGDGKKKGGGKKKDDKKK